ncbi:hypothetical protein EZV62_018595 [Acer yangbiense]|uniref:DUF4283 domain-containing protein n=1 Tax=Acer yangbiense TaxID=1000413 RepID=A0A5C7HLR9_9ROSI|nr:hypothetical protein EZV62_018595 [Acer yangbiense]
MNVNDIASLCNALLIREKERPATILDVNLKDRGKQRLALCLVGKVLASKVVNREAFRDVLKRIWRVNGGVEIEAIEDNIFEFQFKSLEARKRILSGGPWRFDGAIIIFEEPIGSGEIANMEFNKIEFWVQIHNLPLLCMTEEIGLFLGNMIGEVRNVDLEAGKSGSCRFIRARVVIKVDEPLRRSLRVDLLGNGKITTMLLRVDQGRRDWREGGYGFSGQKEVMRSQDNWRNMKKQSETDGDRKGIIRVVGEKVNIGSPASNVACTGIKGSINDPAVSDVHGKSKFGDFQKNGPEVEKDMDTLESIEETGGTSGVKSDILINDQNMGSEEDLGHDPSKGPLVASNTDNLCSPIIIRNDGECSEFGPPKVVQKDIRKPNLISKSFTTWKRVGRGDRGDQNQLSLGVKLGKREGLISGEERKSEIKRYKESIPVVVISHAQ